MRQKVFSILAFLLMAVTGAMAQTETLLTTITATDSEAPFVVETTEEDKTPQVNGTPILAYTSKGIKKIEVYGYVTPTATQYSVTLVDGTDDATSWQGKAGEGEYQSLPLTGLEAGTAVTVKYNGTKKVKSVKAKKKQ